MNWIKKIFQLCKKENLRLSSIKFVMEETLLFRGSCDDEGNIKINLLIPFVDGNKRGSYKRVKKEYQEDYGLICPDDILFKDILEDSIKGGISYRFDSRYFVDTITHELAHLRFKSHSKDHLKYTQKLIKEVDNANLKNIFEMKVMKMKSEKLTLATNYARKCHAKQFRNDGETPYISHPIGVRCILQDLTDDEDIIIAGILHDVVEDTPASLQDVSALFGKRAAMFVEETMKSEDGTYPIKTREGLIIKLADMLHNATDAPSKSWVQKKIKLLNGEWKK